MTTPDPEEYPLPEFEEYPLPDFDEIFDLPDFTDATEIITEPPSQEKI